MEIYIKTTDIKTIKDLNDLHHKLNKAFNTSFKFNIKAYSKDNIIKFWV